MRLWDCVEIIEGAIRRNFPPILDWFGYRSIWCCAHQLTLPTAFGGFKPCTSSHIQEEQLRAVGRGRGSNESVRAFLAKAKRGKGRYNRVDKSKLLGPNCKQRGHEVRTCFRIHGNSRVV